jgi:glutathione S-transferase
VFADGELVLAESGAIIEYVIHTYGGGRLTIAPGEPNYADFLFWWHFANGSMMPAAMTDALVTRLGGGDPLSQSLHARLDRAYDLIDARIAKVPYFAGDYLTAADIIMLFPLTTMRRFAAHNISRYDNVKAYLKRIAERPAYRAAMAKAEPGMPPLLDREATGSITNHYESHPTTPFWRRGDHPPCRVFRTYLGAPSLDLMEKSQVARTKAVNGRGFDFRASCFLVPARLANTPED